MLFNPQGPQYRQHTHFPDKKQGGNPVSGAFANKPSTDIVAAGVTGSDF